MEPCWHHVKGVDLSNFVPINDEELVSKVDQAAERSNEEKLLPAFFKHARVKI